MTLVRLVSEHLGDGGQAEAELAEQEDPLETDQGPLVVVPVAVAADAVGLEQADRAVVAPRATRGLCQPCDVLDRPVHVAAPVAVLCGHDERS